ncbi:MAG: glucuronate isomerase [Ruminococcus sp.]|nr:glucuronate isomerase [Ruminococcus sp.]
MKQFMDENFLLSTETAQKLYHEYAEVMPVLDYHCHLNPQEIYEDRKFENITQVWLGGDHYKWRQMRSNGVEEKYITGDAPDREKFQKWAETLEMAIGNPLYHWSHLELKKYFGYNGYLSGETAEEVWNICNEKLQNGLSARKLIEMSNVTLVCTTDDPIDSLEWHKKIKEDEGFNVQVLPTWRPEKAMGVAKPDYLDYVQKLSTISGVEVKDFDSLIEALKIRLDYFVEVGCVITDHSLDYVMYEEASKEEVDAIYAKRLAGEMLTLSERRKFETAFMVALGKEYNKRNMAMQLHFAVKRDNNQSIYSKLGADAGIDCISNHTPSSEMADFLNALAATDELPKTILYSLNPADNAAIGTIIGCFQDSTAVGKIQQGSAWWFNDHKPGMIEQMTSLASLGLLGNFIGMLTDSRSFLSYTRHEYFRRIMCELIGGWVENGEYPADYKVLEKIVKGISYNNAVRYFGFDL